MILPGMYQSCVKLVYVEAVDLGHGLHLVDVADGPDDEVLPRRKEVLRRLAPGSGRAPGDHHQLCDDSTEGDGTTDDD